MKWHYKFMWLSEAEFEMAANALGELGWELVSVWPEERTGWNVGPPVMRKGMGVVFKRHP